MFVLRSMDPTGAFNAANTLRWENRMDRYANVSALCLFVWDYCLTFNNEVQYFWGSRWSLVKCLFFVNRYFTFVLVVFTVFCQQTFMFGVLALKQLQLIFIRPQTRIRMF
ncbi:hypothetical protein FB451DRAFT_61661 [Mycena latifolia]|nr:hypothetical protein FB451DRAFT_61661 [Mycena latifolia]